MTRVRWQLTDAEFSTMAVEIAKLLDGLSVSEAEAVLHEAAGVIKLSQYIDTGREEFTIRTEQYLRSKTEYPFTDERLERTSPIHPTVARLVQLQHLIARDGSMAEAGSARAEESPIAAA